MFQKSLILCTIPARGRSKGLPGKNLKPLDGKPLIAYAITAARGSKYVDRVVVSTEDPKIAVIAKNFGAEVPILRPKKLASDTVPTLPVVLHMVEYLQKADGFRPDIHVLVQPTSPLVTSSDIDAAIETMVRAKTNACISVSEISERPEWMYSISKGNLIAYSPGKAKRRQDLSKLFRSNGAVSVTKIGALSKGFFILGSTSAYVMPKERSIDIDDPFDFSVAEFLMRKKRI